MTLFDNLNTQEKLALRNVASELTNEQKNILFAVASTGEYSAKGIFKILAHNGINMEMTQFYGNLNELVAGVTMKRTAIRLSTGQEKPASAFELTRVGSALYEKEFGKTPKVSLLKKLEEEYKSEDRGHTIREIEKALKERGFITSVEDETKTPSGATTICDIKAQKDNSVFRIEYEEGNYCEQDYFHKFSRIFEVTKDLRIISRNMDTKKKLLQIVSRYVVTHWHGVGAKERFKNDGFTASVVTVEEFLKNPEWPF